MAAAKILSLFLMLAGAVTFGPARAEHGPLAECEIPGVAGKARCGSFEVPENPERPDGRKISIAVVVLPATGGKAAKDPIVPLNGGPGEDAISTVADYAELFQPLRSDRDILFVDQRGTGKSASLACRLWSEDEWSDNLRDFFVPASVRRCRESLESRADLTQYTYLHFARDLEYVRRALGYGPLNLHALSFGTRAAQHFLRAYPASIRTIYWGSVVPVDVPIPLPMAKAAQGALEKTFAACDAEPACHAAFPDPRSDFKRTMALLAEKRAARAKSAQGAPQDFPDPGRFAEWVRSRLYRPSGATELPAIFHEAAAGNFRRITRAVLESARSRDSALSFGLFFTITCSDDIPFITEGETERDTAGTFFGDYRVRSQQAVCRDWPRSPLPPDHRKPVVSKAPSLFVSGDSDPATPLWFTEHVAPNFANRVQVVVHGHGHTEWNACLAALNEKLVRSGSVAELHGATCPAVPRPPFVIELPAS
jgi:pimeloyl-ACP methyl ester carboxylesterase